MADAENTIAFQGVPGAHSDLACRQAHPYMKTAAYDNFDDVFEAVENGDAKYGMIPFENSVAGRVAEIHNLLPHTNLHMVGEHFQKIEHHLLAPKGATLDSIETVYSHPQALMQCRKSLKELGVKTENHSNTATAAKAVSEWNDPTKAALASELAGELYGLEVVKPNMQDSDDNRTLFIFFAQEPEDIDAKEKHVVTSVLFTVRNIPAGLYKALGGFATNGVNLLKLESYIPGGLSESAQFFASLEGNPEDQNVKLAIEELGFFTKSVKVLGVYPADPLRFGKK